MSMNRTNDRKGEKGAAMVMVLLLSLLLLTASAGLLMETSMNTQNVSDATAEQQAYNAAESGLQATINVLRGHVAPNPLIDPSKPADDPANLINFRKAITPSISNADHDSAGYARLSRWLNYNYSSTGGLHKDRITLGSSAENYDPQTGFSYSISISDPDRTGEVVAFNTRAEFLDTDNVWKSSLTKGNMTISYIPIDPSRPTLDVSSGEKATDFGEFRVRISSGSVTLDDDIRFQIIVNMTAPYNATKVMRGWIKGARTFSVGQNITFDFDSPVYDVMGSSFSLNTNPLQVNIVDASSMDSTKIHGKVTQPEPFRVLIRSVGYGPRGARKELEAIVQKNFFNGLSAPATLTMVGADNSNFAFSAGSSQNVTYSGQDKVGLGIIPSIGTTNKGNLMKVLDNLSGAGKKADIIGYPADISAELPFWLQSPENLHRTLEDLKRVAISAGRYYTAGQTPPNLGNVATATGITFKEGDLDLSGNGGGILVCTGKLTLRGNFKFNGLIIVTGAGGIDRKGGGNGFLEGNTVIAPYDPNNLAAGFLAPRYDISGGGTSEIVFNSSSVANGMTAVSNFVLGVAEK